MLRFKYFIYFNNFVVVQEMLQLKLDSTFSQNIDSSLLSQQFDEISLKSYSAKLTSLSQFYSELIGFR